MGYVPHVETGNNNLDIQEVIAYGRNAIRRVRDHRNFFQSSQQDYSCSS